MYDWNDYHSYRDDIERGDYMPETISEHNIDYLRTQLEYVLDQLYKKDDVDLCGVDESLAFMAEILKVSMPENQIKIRGEI